MISVLQHVEFQSWNRHLSKRILSQSIYLGRLYFSKWLCIINICWAVLESTRSFSDSDFHTLSGVNMSIGIQSYLYSQYLNDDCHVFNMRWKLYLIEPLLVLNYSVSYNCFSCFISWIVSPIVGMGRISNKFFGFMV